MNGKKVLVTGSSGMLGSCIINFFNASNVIGFDVDVTDSESVYKELRQESPDVIIHTAAYTDVDGCELYADKAYKVNTLGTQNLVNYCIGRDVLFIFISSTGVYGSLKTSAYTEFDRAEPTTVHHKSKYSAELAVQNHLDKYLIIRTGWLYGGCEKRKKNFVCQRILDATNNEKMYSDESQLGNPTSVYDLITQIELLVKSRQFGVFNCVNKARNISRFDYVKEIVSLSGASCEVKVAGEGLFKRGAPVSNNESAINYKLDLLGLNVMGPWENSLAEYVKRLKINHDD